MFFFSQPEVIQILGDKARDKSKIGFWRLLLLAIQGGAFIAFGYMFFIRVVGLLPKELSSLGNLLGGMSFPIGLIAIVMVGGELVTGNMMVMMLGRLQNKVQTKDVIFNWLVVLLGNVIGGIIVAYLFGHFVGITEGAYLEKTLAVAQAKINDPPLVAFISGIGCNIFVCMAVWMGSMGKDGAAKYFGLWFPIVAFVAIGFQHVVANAFVVPAAMFSGQSDITVAQFIVNTIVVFLGNATGGALAIALPAHLTYAKNMPSVAAVEAETIIE